ncbi:MAG: hypothetical protein P1V36_08205 [Planctomycetota bacterium]|nr:hypothetical protein [Planctomycetota bacterium]
MRYPVRVLVGALLAVALLFVPSGVVHAADAEPWSGDWMMSFGMLKLKQDGTTLTGTYGNQGQFSIEGTVDGSKATFRYTEGNISSTGAWELQPSGHAFRGHLVMGNGGRKDWHGWRADPSAKKGKAKSKGLWLTSLGLMELKAKGKRAEGRFALRGGSTFSGDFSGRHLELQYQVLRGGQAWFDFAKDGKTFAGAASDHGASGWFGWEGRKADEYKRHAKLKPGKQVAGSTENLLTYQVHAPKGWRRGTKYPCILILHGSNMNSDAYVNTLAKAFPTLAERYIILGINGERPSHIGKPKARSGAPAKGSAPAFNYTYVNFVGKSTFKGFPGTDKESPALVSDAMTELAKVYGISRYFVGGHSQGGYLTYSLLMNYPEQIAGAFPIAGAVIFQCEPSAYDNAPLRAAQRATPLAIVHAKNDPVVGFGSSRYAHELFREEGWSAHRLFAPDQGAHMFARMPLVEVMAWLESVAGEDLELNLASAEASAAAKDWAHVLAVVAHAESRPDAAKFKHSITGLRGMAEQAAQAGAARFGPLVAANADPAWIDELLVYRESFAHAAAAADVMKAFEALRAEHDKGADAAYQAARNCFNQRDQDGGYAKYQEIVDQYYASRRYRSVKRWIAERK